MTLVTHQSDKLFSNKIGVAVPDKDNQPNPFMRQKLLLSIKTLLRSSNNPACMQVYSYAYEACSNYAKTLEDLKKDLDYELATRKVMAEDSKDMRTEYDYTYYMNQVKCFENVLDLIQQQKDKGEK